MSNQQGNDIKMASPCVVTSIQLFGKSTGKNPD